MNKQKTTKYCADCAFYSPYYCRTPEGTFEIRNAGLCRNFSVSGVFGYDTPACNLIMLPAEKCRTRKITLTINEDLFALLSKIARQHCRTTKSGNPAGIASVCKKF